MNKSIIIPTELREIKLSAFQKYMSIEEPTDEQAVSIFCGVNPIDVLRLPTEVYEKSVNTLANLLTKVNNKQQLINKFMHNGVKYGMIPNLDKITYGANKDIVGTIGDWSKMHIAMNALYRPITESNRDYYKIKEYQGEDTIDDLKDMPLDIVLGARFFFYDLTNALLKAIPSYLERVVKQEIQGKGVMQTQFTKENGEAMMKHIASLKETLEDSMR